MRRATLIVNPKAGAAHRLAGHSLAMERLFAKFGFLVELVQTTAALHSARDLASTAAQHCDLIVACGGDGTVHGVVQGIANTPACLGVLPFGTANALARNLGLPMDPLAALEKLLTFQPREIPLGVAKTNTETRRFTVMAGAGPDGRLVHEMKLATKARAGRRAYYAEAARLFLRRRFPAFSVAYRAAGSGKWTSLTAVAMMASRIPDLGGIFRGLTADSRLHHPHLVAKILSPPACLSLPAWFAIGRGGLRVGNPWLTTLQVEEIRCSAYEPSNEIYAQVDGETLGTLPMSITIEPKALRLLMPSHLSAS